MVTILFWSALAVVCALACAGLLIVAIRQRKVAFVVAAVTVFLVGGYCGFRAVHEILQRSRTKLALALNHAAARRSTRRSSVVPSGTVW